MFLSWLLLNDPPARSESTFLSVGVPELAHVYSQDSAVIACGMPMSRGSRALRAALQHPQRGAAHLGAPVARRRLGEVGLVFRMPGAEGLAVGQNQWYFFSGD